MVFRPLLDALLAGAPLGDIRSIVEEAPEEETRGRALYDTIVEAMKSMRVHSDVIVFLIMQDPSCTFLQCSKSQRFLLHVACLYRTDDSELIQHLIELNPGAVNEANDEGCYPLHDALFENASLATVKLLVNHGAEVVRMKIANDKLPVHISFQYAEADVTRFLIQQYPEGAGAIDGYGRLPIHHACRSAEFGLPMHRGCVKESPMDLIRLLIEVHPAGLHVQDSAGELPLHLASRGNVNVLQLLLVLYPDGIHVADNDGWLPLHQACLCLFTRNLDQVRLLVHSDPLTLLCKTHHGETPLKLAQCPLVENEIKAFLLEEQETLVRAHRYAVEFVAKVQLGFSDLVVNKIWQFAQPDVWHPSDEN